MPYLIARTNKTTSITDYLLGHGENGTSWGQQRHKAPRFPTRKEADALLPTLGDRDYEVRVEEETEYHRLASLL